MVTHQSDKLGRFAQNFRRIFLIDSYVLHVNNRSKWSIFWWVWLAITWHQFKN